MTKILNHKLGKLFPPAMRVTGWVFMAVGLYFFISSLIMAYIPFAVSASAFVLIGIFIGVTPHGVLIDLETKKYKKYTNIFGYKQGSWNSYERFPYISLLQNTVKTHAFSKSNRQAETGSNLYYEICLLNKTHRKKVVIKRLKDRDIAMEDINILAKQLDIELTKYSPVISQSSQATKNRRR